MSCGGGVRPTYCGGPPTRLHCTMTLDTAPETTAEPKAETRAFQAEVSRLLDIVAHSLYSEKERFLRELISNASDACDRLRYAALTEPKLADGDANYRVVLTPVKSSRTLTVADNGVGMNHDELVENLGTIARSGTAAFMKELSGDAKPDMSLIGQFGVGFYSAFMVADRVEVLSRKAGEEEGWRWVSDGQGSFTIEPAANVPRGARIALHMREGGDEFLEPHRLRQIGKTYSDHIALPIVLAYGKKASEAPQEYAKFWDAFGAVLKEGLYEDREQRETLLPLARFRSTTRDELVSLDDYVAAMKPGQEAIYTIIGDTLDLLKKSPQ